MKFRISLSQSQIQYILSCPDCPEDLKTQLELALFKVSKGLVKPAYEIKEKPKKSLSMEQKYVLACDFLERGQSIPEELMNAYSEYRYLNGLMTEEESAEYEQTQGF